MAQQRKEWDDQMQFERIKEEYYRYIYNFAMKLSCHPQAAEDLTQETFYRHIKIFIN
jgi:DNA-directed RNA polymerase specialized sigma24 family protein